MPRAAAPWLLLGPVLAGLALLLAVPIALLAASSFTRLDLSSFTTIDPLTLFNYRRFLGDGYYLGVLATTLKLAVLVTAVCLAAGYPVAMRLCAAAPRERDLLLLV